MDLNPRQNFVQIVFNEIVAFFQQLGQIEN